MLSYITLMLSGVLLGYGVHLGRQGSHQSTYMLRTSPTLLSHTSRYVAGGNNRWISYRIWGDEENARGVVFFSHGYAEYSGRYELFFEKFVDAGFVVFSYDAQGHGASSGDRGYFEYFTDLVDDAEKVLAKARHDLPTNIPWILASHSMGGAVNAQLYNRTASVWSAVVMTSPLLGVHPSVATPLNHFLATTLSPLLPRLPVDNIDPSKISENKENREWYMKDPLNYVGMVSARVGCELMLHAPVAQSVLLSISTPLLLVKGGKDTLVSIQAIDQVAEENPTHTTYFTYPTLGHEVLFEGKQGEEVMDRIVQWSKEQGAK